MSSEQESILSEEKSVQLASFLEMLKPTIHLINEITRLDYLKSLEKGFREKASRYDSADVLMSHWNSEQSKLFDMEADAMKFLRKYIETLIEIDKKKVEINKSNEVQDAINKLFL